MNVIPDIDITNEGPSVTYASKENGPFMTKGVKVSTRVPKNLETERKIYKTFLRRLTHYGLIEDLNRENIIIQVVQRKHFFTIF